MLSMYASTCFPSHNMIFLPFGNAKLCGIIISDYNRHTTVVILRKNMRQRKQTAEDAKLRTALENMRYAACTPEDIKFLKTRIAGRRSDQPKLSDKDHRALHYQRAGRSCCGMASR